MNFDDKNLFKSAFSWHQAFRLHAAPMHQELMIHLQTTFEERLYDIVSVPLQTLLDDFVQFSEVEQVGCMTKELQAASFALRRAAEQLDNQLAKNHATAKLGCCSWCDDQVQYADRNES
ncbi:hypothetical protein [Undibacterium pigrum]|uniref:Uncharacterized protein n=1 Tax=Undibacterium pigrum TaxID=401470 RepID=A0A318JDK6_9BURK|nr:hypothetical protein [Undibacterium pigrum]PXX47041.1 hypothetical protein DFR42_101617 [Undibacterium pigrum]